MHGAVVILYFLVFLANKIDGYATHKIQTRIVGGDSVDIIHRPFMLSLHSLNGPLCGATILSKTWAITAAHCLSPRQSKYFVRAGSNKWNTGGSVHWVRNIHVYNTTEVPYFPVLYHDIALFEVKPEFRFSTTIQPIHLPRLTDQIPRELVVCGWGLINFAKEVSPESLRCVDVQYVPYKTCVKTNNLYKEIMQSYQLCYGTEGKDSCHGDSGGALADKTTIYGIVAYGWSCGKGPSVYTNVLHYRKWIKAVTNL